MCTRPISINKRFADGSVKTYTVPCGRCSECRSLKQQQFAALSVVEGYGRSSLGFLTITYSQDWLPFRLGVFGSDGPVCDSLSRGRYMSGPVLDCCKLSCDVTFTADGWYCPSLYRKDIQDWIKRFRSSCRRAGIDLSRFAFSVFGEYGDRRHRPHYHMLCYGLDRSQLNMFASLWKFGNVRVDFVNRLNSDGSDAFGKVSSYISKYIAKGDYVPNFVSAGFAESPRRQSSLGFGRLPSNLVAKYKSFTLPMTYPVKIGYRLS